MCVSVCVCVCVCVSNTALASAVSPLKAKERYQQKALDTRTKLLKLLLVAKFSLAVTSVIITYLVASRVKLLVAFSATIMHIGTSRDEVCTSVLFVLCSIILSCYRLHTWEFYCISKTYITVLVGEKLFHLINDV